MLFRKDVQVFDLGPLGASPRGASQTRRSFASKSPSKEFVSPWVPTSISDVETFLAGLHFEKRNLLNERPINLKM